MTDYLEIIVKLVTIVTFVGGVFNYAIVKPLRVSIDNLKSSVDKFNESLDEVKENEIKLRERVSVGESKIEDLRNRVIKLETYHTQPIRGTKS